MRTAKELEQIMRNNPIDSDKYMDAWDEAKQLAYDNTFGQVTKQINPEAVQELLEALTTTYEALKDLVRQLPVDERLADYRLDFAESAEQKAIAAIVKATL